MYVRFVHSAFGNEGGGVELVYENTSCLAWEVIHDRRRDRGVVGVFSILNAGGRYVRCLLITESPKTPGHYRYLKWVLGYIPYTGLAVFSLRFLLFLCILRFRFFSSYSQRFRVGVAYN